MCLVYLGILSIKSTTLFLIRSILESRGLSKAHNSSEIGSMSFFSRDTLERSVSKSREKERRSTVSHEQSSDSEAEETKKGGLLEQHHHDIGIPKHSSNEENEVGFMDLIKINF